MKIALIGYGKMGKAIEAIAQSRGHEIVLRVDINSPELLEKDQLSKADVAIEFTTPETAFHNILKCFDANVPVVCGTTGWLEKLPEVKAQCLEKHQAFLYASNFSIGVNIFFELNRRLAELNSEKAIADIRVELTDRFGPLPEPVNMTCSNMWANPVLPGCSFLDPT